MEGMDSTSHCETISSYFASSSRPQTDFSTPSGDSTSDALPSDRQSLYSLASSRTGSRLSTTTSGRKSQPATASSILGTREAQNIICAVAEGRGVTPSVGVAFINISLGEVILSQISDNQSYVKTIHKLQILCPSRIIFQAQACPPNKASILFSLVEELVSEAQLLAFSRSAWSEVAGISFIEDYGLPCDVEPTKVAIQGKFYATASLAAVSSLWDLLGITYQLCRLLNTWNKIFPLRSYHTR